MTGLHEKDRGTERSQDLVFPSVRRRMASFIYEGVLLFGVVMLAGFLFSIVTQQRHALQGVHGLQAFVFVALGIYFVWFWTKAGQTLAMKTWHIRLVDKSGKPVSRPRAMARYALSWIWFAPALAAAEITGARAGAQLSAWMCAGVLLIAAASRWSPDRQFIHDLLCGTRLVEVRPTAATRA